MAQHICPKCGRRVLPDFSFCPYCAAPLEPTEVQPTQKDITSTLELLEQIRTTFSQKTAAEIEAELLPPEESELEPVPQVEGVPLQSESDLPDLSGLYSEDEEEPERNGLQRAIVIVAALIVAVALAGILLWLNPFHWGTAQPAPDAPVQTEEPAPAETPQPEVTPEPTPEATPEPETEPEQPLSREELQQILVEYYGSYLQCINDQAMDALVHTSGGNLVRTQSRVMSDANRKSTFDTTNYQVEPDWDSYSYEDGIIMLNIKFTFSSTLKGGSTATVSGNTQTYKLVQGSGEDGWVVDQTAFVGEDAFAAHTYAFLRQQ